MFTALRLVILTLMDILTGDTMLASTEVANQNQGSKQIDLYIWLAVILVCILIIIFIFYFNKYKAAPLLMPTGTAPLIGKKGTGDESLDKVIEEAGYYYDSKQDIFYSNMYPWQRDHGYCRLYDEAAAPLGMIIDCEPIYFEYKGKRWLIEFWKGQYDLTTGCEIGVYATEESDITIPNIFTGTFYHSVSDEDRLKISFSLIKNGRLIFTRKDKHWWLTGFKLGEFSEPSELVMNLTITLKDKEMLSAFIKGLKNAGYLEDEIIVKGNTVGLKFDRTRTPQPITRKPETDWLIQRKNELLCDKYQDITRGYDNFPDKIKAIQKQAPKMYDQIINIGKTKKLFEQYEKLKDYLS